MPKNSAPRAYTKEQFWQLYEHLPQELKNALFAEETGEVISETCAHYGVEEKTREVADIVGRVLIGLLPPAEFEGALKDIGIKKGAAEKIGAELNRFVFFPVKPSLEQLYKMELDIEAPRHRTPSAGPGLTGAAPSEETAGEGAAEQEQAPPIMPKGPDAYREPLE